MSNAPRIAYLIRSGDVHAARREMPALPAWSAAEATAIRHACAVWGIDAAGFGVANVRPCPPELWPVRASFVLDAVPEYPTGEDFQCASMAAASHAPDPIYSWRCEAIRWRRQHMGQPLDLPAIHDATVGLLALYARRAA